MTAILVAAQRPRRYLRRLKEAAAAGVKIVYVDSPANVDAAATFSTDNAAAGKKAGEEMLKALTDAGVTSGDIGVINVNAATDSCVKREEGFRSAFEAPTSTSWRPSTAMATLLRASPAQRTSSPRA